MIARFFLLSHRIPLLHQSVFTKFSHAISFRKVNSLYDDPSSPSFVLCLPVYLCVSFTCNWFVMGECVPWCAGLFQPVSVMVHCCTSAAFPVLVSAVKYVSTCQMAPRPPHSVNSYPPWKCSDFHPGLRPRSEQDHGQTKRPDFSF